MKAPLLVALLMCCITSYAQESLSPATIIAKKLLTNEKHSFVFNLNTGECVSLIVLQKGVDVVIDVISPSGQKLKTFDAPNDKGEEIVFIEASQTGKYNISIYPFFDELSEQQKTTWKNENPGKSLDSLLIVLKEENQGNYEIQNFKILSATECQKKITDERIALQKTIQWVSQNAHPLKSVVADSGFEDLQWLKPVLKDVKYVGLGEATHGSREFFQMKHRMLEFLVKEMGFTVFAMEASHQGCENINNYIMYGKGDAHTALTSQGFWTWDTEEVIDMIEWMRKYNQTVPENKKVRFFGYDIQIFAKSGAIDSVRNYLRKVDPLFSKQKDSLLRLINKLDYANTLYPLVKTVSKSLLDNVKKEISDLVVVFAMNKGDYIHVSSKEDYEKNFYRLVNLSQFMHPFDYRNRDYYMASNFKNFVQQNPGKKIMLWAHNSHLAKNSSSLGFHLNNAYGTLYYAMSFAFNKGSFQTMEISGTDGKKSGLKEFTVTAAKENTLDWYLAQIKKDRFVINFRQKNLPDYVLNFIGSSLETRGFGAGANRDNYNESYRTVLLQKDFDAVIFINSTTRARPTATGIR